MRERQLRGVSERRIGLVVSFDYAFRLPTLIDGLRALAELGYQVDVLAPSDSTMPIHFDTDRVQLYSLERPGSGVYSRLRFGDYRAGQFAKFYGLPLEPPPDRHRWFFSYEEAEKFILYRAGLNRMRVLQMEPEGMGREPTRWKRLARMVLFHNDLNLKTLYAGALWAVLEKITDG